MTLLAAARVERLFIPLPIMHLLIEGACPIHPAISGHYDYNYSACTPYGAPHTVKDRKEQGTEVSASYHRFHPGSAVSNGQHDWTDSAFHRARHDEL